MDTIDVVKTLGKIILWSMAGAVVWGTLMIIGFLVALLGYDRFMHSSKKNRWVRYE